MIFDLLTIKNAYNRIPLYPNSNNVNPFTCVDATGYEIEEGYYFEFMWDGYEARVFATISISRAEIGRIHAIKFTYRSNRGIRIQSRQNPITKANFPASETFTTATVLFNSIITDMQFYIDIMDESCDLNPEEMPDGYPEKGDYLIIKNIEILQLKS